MAAEVETMFYVSNETNGRFVPWHGLGTPVEDAPDSTTAIIKAGLDWKVDQHEAKDGVTGRVVPNCWVNARSSDNMPLGIVGGRYEVVQNKEAFAFTDSMLGEGVRYETAGSLKDGKIIWLLAKMDSVDVLGDEVVPYMLFTNNHDGKGTVKVAMTPVRVVCNNTLNFALEGAKRTWNTRHIGDIATKMEEAKSTLGLATKYMENLSATADILANIDINSSKLSTIVDNVFPIKNNMSKRAVNAAEIARARFASAYNAPDIARFRDTGWGVVNAIADYGDHYVDVKNKTLSKENNFLKVVNGLKLLDTTVTQVKKVA